MPLPRFTGEDDLRRGGDSRAVEHEPVAAGRDLHRLAVLDLAGQDELGERILHRFLDHAFERPRAVSRIVALVGEPIARLGVERDRDLALLQKLLQMRELNIHDPSHLLAL